LAITGAHVLLYSSEPEAVRSILRDVFGWRHVDAGDGWLIFALPPAEVGVHPAEYLVRRDLSLMCDDIHATMEELRRKGVEFRGEPVDEGFGIGVDDAAPGRSRAAALRAAARDCDLIDVAPASACSRARCEHRLDVERRRREVCLRWNASIDGA
jgi:hypothetical protein